MPFRGYKHAAGLLAGLTAGVLSYAIEKIYPDIPFMGVGLCTLGALHTYLLSLMNRSLAGSLVALNGGFFLGVLGYGLVALFASEAAPEPGLMPRITNPFLFVAICPLLGIGPMLLVLFFQKNRPRGVIPRLFLGAVAGIMAAAAGLVAYNLFNDFGIGGTDGELSDTPARIAGFAAAGYVLFRLHLLFLLESAGGDAAQRSEPSAPASAAPASKDDEP